MHDAVKGTGCLSTNITAYSLRRLTLLAWMGVGKVCITGFQWNYPPPEVFKQWPRIRKTEEKRFQG
jgi:hypothetical protein